MNSFLQEFFDSGDKQVIEQVHRIQENLYGVYLPPSLKQLKSLRYLLIRTGSLPEIQSENLLGLSKAECNVILKKLNNIYISQRRNHSWNEVNHVGKYGRQY